MADGQAQRIVFPGGFLDVRLTPWDARALGFGTAEILQIELADPVGAAAGLAAAEAWALGQGVRYLFGRFPGTRPLRRALEEAAFAHVETSLHVSGRLPTPRPWRSAASLEVTPLTAEHLSIVRSMAERAVGHGRFLEDPLIDEEAARRRTGNWIEDLADQGLAWAVVQGTRTVGFHAARISASGTEAELILSGAATQWSMLGPALWQAVLAQMHDEGVLRCTTVVSAANTGVVNVYAALGFRIDAATLGYRRFLDR